MAKVSFRLVMPERELVNTEADMVVVPGSEGEMGIMAGHAPVMTTIKDNAELAVYRTSGGNPEKIRVSGGFAEVGDNGLTVLAESAGE